MSGEGLGMFALGMGMGMRSEHYHCEKCGKRHRKESDIGYKHQAHEKKKKAKKKV